MQNISGERTLYIFLILCDTQRDIQNQKLFYSIEGVQAFLLLLLIWYNNGAHLIYIWLCISSLVLILEGLLIVDLFTAVSLN